jgi:hypothetical protein
MHVSDSSGTCFLACVAEDSAYRDKAYVLVNPREEKAAERWSE